MTSTPTSPRPTSCSSSAPTTSSIRTRRQARLADLRDADPRGLRAGTVIVVKRSLNPGFSGIDNPLYYRDNTMMVFGDARAVVEAMVKELKGAPVHG